MSKAEEMLRARGGEYKMYAGKHEKIDLSYLIYLIKAR